MSNKYKFNQYKHTVIANYGSISFTRVSNMFNDHCYMVQDTLSENIYCFEFYPDITWYEREAYRQAAQKYNELVPESECIPLF